MASTSSLENNLGQSMFCPAINLVKYNDVLLSDPKINSDYFHPENMFDGVKLVDIISWFSDEENYRLISMIRFRH